MEYDASSAQSILEYSKKLPGHSLDELIDFTELAENLKNKGNLGTLVEEYFFKIYPGNEQAPDFKKAGVELKTTGVIRKSNGSYKAKERLVLSMIDYLGLVNESWEDNSLMKKCKQMLILFYIYDRDLPAIKRKFAFRPLLWDFPKNDLEIIRQDWQTIVDKIKKGLAHELSEGDTFYLAACRKGSGGSKETLRKQPFSSELAKSRAFSLKPSYVNKMVELASTKEDNQSDSLFSSEYQASAGFSNIVKMRLHKFIGKTIKELAIELDFHNPNNDKSYRRSLVIRMLGGKTKQLKELVEADIELKVITVRDKFKPKEDMSFPYFSYFEISEQEWEDSEFFKVLERKFLFAVFEEKDNGEMIFRGANFWNMPYEDKLEAQKVWEKTKNQIMEGHAENLPKKSDNRVAHVRPHAKNASDTLDTPQGAQLVKKCFWLNSSYIQSQLRQIFKS